MIDEATAGFQGKSVEKFLHLLPLDVPHQFVPKTPDEVDPDTVDFVFRSIGRTNRACFFSCGPSNSRVDIAFDARIVSFRRPLR